MKKKDTATIKRKYSIPDDQFILKADLILQWLTEGLQSFTKFDPFINDEFTALMGEKIKLAEKNPTPLSRNEATMINSDKIKKLMQEARDKYMYVKYFIQKSFPRQRAIWNEFGVKDYLKVRLNNMRMVPFLTQLALCMEKYNQQLTQNGMDVNALTDIKSLCSKLEKENTGLEQGKKGSLSKTQQRIIVKNEVYDMVMTVCNAAKYVYTTDATRRKLFTLYQGVSRKRKKKEEKTEEGDM